MRKAGYIFLLFWMPAHFAAFCQTSYYETVSKGLWYQIQADSMQRLADAQVLALSSAPESAKNNMRMAIRNHEAQVLEFQKKANEWFARAVTFEEVSVPKEAENDILLPEKLDTDTIAEVKARVKPEPQIIQDFEFAILSKSPYSASNPVPIDKPLPDGVVYKIQLGAFSKPLPANTYKGLTPLSGEKLSNGITKYYAGLFRRFADAEDALRKVHEYGFKDAYIVAFFNRVTINTNRAKQLETN